MPVVSDNVPPVLHHVSNDLQLLPDWDLHHQSAGASQRSGSSDDSADQIARGVCGGKLVTVQEACDYKVNVMLRSLWEDSMTS
jgi:hypothetical protein